MPGKSIARLLDELGRGAIGRHHDHGLDRRLLRSQLVDRVVDVHGVALVVEPHDRAIIGTERTKRLGDARKARIAIGILLGEDRDLSG